MPPFTHRFAVIFAAFLLLAAHASAETPASPAKEGSIHSAEAARSDLKQLYETLQVSHFDLFVHRSRSEYDQRYESLLKALDSPISQFELQVALQKFMAFGRVAHSRIDFPSLEFERYRASGGGILPLQVKLRDGRAWVVADLGEAADPEIAAGEEIVAINGSSFKQWRERLVAHVSADNDRLADTLLELRFTALLWLELGPTESFELAIRDQAGKVRTLQRPVRSREQMQAAARRQPKRLELDWSTREARMLDANVAYLRPGPFFDARPDAQDMWDTTEFAAFIDTSLAEFAESGAQSLIIDLRDNPGGDNSFSDLLARRYADQTFRFASDFKIRVSEAAIASNAKRLHPGKNTGTAAQLANAYAGHEPGEIIDFPVPGVDPAAKTQRFQGRVFVLINRYSYSNAVMLAALSQDFHFATIIGEETADLASTYGAMEQFTLDHSGIAVGFPKAHIVRPSGDEASRGVVPDIVIETPLLEGENDPVLDRAIRIARADN
ncbi:S41 family peptidase [Dokdonella sp.]|uniref:S41 family peptidase n=1 Tax=Dokdonella sp. TaxID=2291710 RepID=UPI003529C7AA